MAAEIQGGSCLVWRSPGDVAALPARQGVSECLPGGTLGWGEGVCLSVCLSAGARGELCPPTSLPRPTVPHRAARLLLTPCLTPFSKRKRASGSARTPAGNAARLSGLAREPQNAHIPLHVAWDIWVFLPRPHPDAVGNPRPCPVAMALLGVAAGLQQNHIVRANPVAPLCQPRGPFWATKSHEAAPASPSVELPAAGRAPWRCLPPYLVLARSIYRGRAFCSGRKHPPARPHPAGTGQDGLGSLPATQQRPSC